ncbi:MAG TPA: hypothetical protein VHD33_05100, partial [Legionellaceae bacterium]|nr:hypothetical protein [Legionellaceae bacterium]
MSRSDEIEKILHYFPTERFKRFTYSTRPFTTVVMGITLVGLGWLHILSMPIACWLLAAFVLDNIALTPIMGAINAVNHLLNSRKILKASIMLAAISLSLISGAYLGYFYLAPMPMIAQVLSKYITITGCSPFLISIGAMLGAYVSHTTHKIPLFWGIFFGSCLASIVYIPV